MKAINILSVIFFLCTILFITMPVIAQEAMVVLGNKTKHLFWVLFALAVLVTVSTPKKKETNNG